MSIEKTVSKFTSRLPQPLASLAIVSDHDLREKAKVENSAAELLKKVADIVLEKICAARNDRSGSVKNNSEALIIEIPQEIINKSLPLDSGRYESSVVGLVMKSIQAGLSKKGYSSEYVNLASYDDLVSGHLLIVGLSQGQILSGVTQEIVKRRVTNAA